LTVSLHFSFFSKQKPASDDVSAAWSQGSDGSLRLEHCELSFISKFLNLSYSIVGNAKSRTSISIQGGCGNIMVGDHNTFVVYNKGSAGPGNAPSASPQPCGVSPKEKKIITGDSLDF
jgi:hypothetical protein